MKIEQNVTVKKERKLVAVIGDGAFGYFIRASPGSDSFPSIYVGNDGKAQAHSYTLEETLEKRNPSQAVYEGDSFTISF